MNLNLIFFHVYYVTDFITINIIIFEKNLYYYHFNFNFN